MPKIKNILIFVAVGVVIILAYVFFIKKSPEQPGLISTSSNPVASSGDASAQDTAITRDFLALLLNVKNIKLDDAIFSDVAFTTLRDSSIVLTPDGTEGRPNPFAPLGVESAPAAASTPASATAAPNTPSTSSGPSATPTKNPILPLTP